MGLTGQNGLEAGVCRGKGTAAAKTLSQEQGVMLRHQKKTRVAGLQNLREIAGG